MAFVSFRNLIRHSTTRTTKLGTCSPRKRNFGELHSCHPKEIPLLFSIMSIPTRDTSTSPRCPCPIKTFGATTEQLLFTFRSEERRVGHEYVSHCNTRWSPSH